MKSRTSFSKLTTFKKDITRYAPIWALYLIGMMMVLFEGTNYGSYDRVARNLVAELPTAFAIVNVIYAGVCAVMLFGDLYNTRMCYSLHTLPQRRESWLLSHLASGFLFSLIPNLVASLYLMLRLEDYWFLALYFLLAAELEFLFFYGVATVSAMLTGNRFAMLLVYAGINFVSMLAYATVTVIYLPMLTGVVADLSSFAKFCPTVYLCDQFDFFTFESVDVYNEQWHEMSTFYQYTGLGTGWGYLALIAAIGLGLMGLSVLLYRWRHLECAGDFVAFRKLNAPACLIMTLCVGLLCAVLGDSLGNGYVLWLAVGVIIGYFGSLMLLERRVKVFRPKVFVWFGVLCAVLAASILMIESDVFGIVSWTPKASQVQSVTVANYNSSSYHFDGYYYGNRLAVTLTEEEEIAEIIEAHQDILDRLDDYHNGSVHRVVITYKLDSGRTVKRSYSAPANGTNYEIISRYFYTPAQILGYGNGSWEEFVDNVDYMWFNGGEIPSDMHDAMMEALKADCEAGYVKTTAENDFCYWLDFEVSQGNSSYYRSLAIMEGAENTLKLLSSPEMTMGYTDWDAFLRGLQNVFINGEAIPLTQYEALLTAIKLDCESGWINYDNYDGFYTVEYSVVVNGSYVWRNFYIPNYAENTMTWFTENGY